MTRPELSDDVLQAAAAWRTRQDSGPLTPADEAAFLSWLETDPRHAAAFQELDATWTVLDRVSEVAPSTLGVAADSPAASRSRTVTPARRRWLPVTLAAAASIAALVLLWPRPEATSSRAVTVTSADAFKRLTLPDGSIAYLMGDSDLAVDFRAAERRVRLVRGEAHFTVAKDAARPFVVEVRGLLARAIGTAFTVSSLTNAVEVCVTEGRVRVETRDPAAAFSDPLPILAAGDKLTVRAPDDPAPVAAPVVRLSPAQIAQTLSWQRYTLAFDAAPLATIVAEFNRYNAHQLVIDDEVLARRKFGGSFRADDPEGFVALIAATADVVIDRRGDRTHLRLAR
jgi:transmembrane sensor